LQAIAILFGGLFTVAVATALGSSLLRESCEDLGVRFITGAAALSVAVFGLCAAQLAYPLVFGILGVAALFLWRANRSLTFAALKHPSPDRKRAVAGDWPTPLLFLAFSLYFILYFFNSMAPEASFDGSRYHLALVGRYLREHGLHRITDNMYASLSQGVEMLYLWAFAFGQHSAAAMVHFAFLLALVWQMFRYGRRIGLPVAGACGALLVFASPVVGVDGTSAYNDVAVAAIAFTLFHLLQIWDEVRAPRLLVAIGLVAGFGYAAKYTACLGVIYALGFVAWKSRRRIRETAIVAVCASVLIVPWMVKNWIWVANPFSPFLNGLFPNPYVTVSFEQEYRHHMALYELGSRWQIPMQATTYGSLSSLLGPVFLLSPIALLALRRREGRQLLLAALVFGATYFSNISTRFLIPPLPFVALAMALVLGRVPRLLVAVALLHSLISWPSVAARYCHSDAWHLVKVPWREALRIKPEGPYLESNLPLYGAARLVERTAAAGSTVFAFTPIPDAYTSRKILVAYQSSENVTIREILWSAFTPDYQPTWRLRFSFPPQPLRAVRVVQTNSGADLWSINELRVGQALPPANRPRWRLDAQPYPWGIGDAFDGKIVTFWKCGEALRSGQFVEVDFRGVESADSVLIEAAPNQWGIRLKLEGQDASGQWKLLAAQPQVGDAPVPPGLRRAAADELKRRGIDYLLVFDGEFGADDLARNSGLWGIRQVGEYKGARLYRLP